MNRHNFFMAIFVSLVLLLTTLGCTSWTASNHRGPIPSSPEGHPYLITKDHMEQFKSSMRPSAVDADLSYRMGLFFQKRDKNEQAVAEFDKAVRLNPELVDAYNAMGISYDRLGNYEAARASYSMALTINPALDYVQNNMGYSYFLEKKYDAALQWIEIAAAAKPNNRRYQNNLVMVYLKNVKPEMAVATLRKAPRTDHTDKITTQGRHLEKKPAPYRLGLDENKKITKFYKIEAPLDYRYSDEEKDPDNQQKMVTPDPIVKAEGVIFVEPVEIFPSMVAKGPSNVDLRPSPRPEPRLAALIPMDKPGKDLPIIIEVSNGNGVEGMAKRLGEFLKDLGFKVTRLTNAINFDFKETKIYYPEIYKDSVQILAAEIPGFEASGNLVSIRKSGNRVRILIGKDLVPIDDILNGRLVVEVSNGNGVNGSAGRLGSYLKDKGLADSVNLTNARHFDHGNTQIYYGGGRRKIASYLARELPGNLSCSLIQSEEPGAAIRVLIGKDFVY